MHVQYVLMPLFSKGIQKGCLGTEWSPALCSSMGNICFFVLCISASVNMGVDQHFIRDDDEQGKYGLQTIPCDHFPCG